MTEPKQGDRANPLAAALDALETALLTFTAEVAARDETLATEVLEKTALAINAVLDGPRYMSPDKSATSYDTAIRSAVRCQVNAILDKAREVTAARRSQHF
ncbi:hypothetical protein [Methylobacterium oxalidis]|nr:hypothetical protein [Methylobacterium oxalidis]GJE33967.1 hypothetical protein LDDCCGHA_4171 [Methylobacterium oxalidis]